jgi:hypothetical protein
MESGGTTKQMVMATNRFSKRCYEFSFPPEYALFPAYKL